MNLITATLLVTVAVLNVSALNATNDLDVEAPYLVSVRSERGPKCGGSIIDEQFVLTLAECVPYNPEEYTVHIKLPNNTDSGKQLKVEKIIRHELFDSNVGRDYDIALLKLTEKINFNNFLYKKKMEDNLTHPYVTKIPLFIGKPRETYQITVFGWGKNIVNTSDSESSRINLQTFPEWICKLKYEEMFTPRMICSSGRYDKICNVERGFYDMGGPAVYENTLIGIVSFVDQPCDKKLQVYTYIQPLTGWIYENMSRNR